MTGQARGRVGAKLVGGIHKTMLDWQDHKEGKRPYTFLLVDRGLKGGKLDEVRLTEAEMLRLIEDAAKFLRLEQEVV